MNFTFCIALILKYIIVQYSRPCTSYNKRKEPCASGRFYRKVSGNYNLIFPQFIMNKRAVERLIGNIIFCNAGTNVIVVLNFARLRKVEINIMYVVLINLKLNHFRENNRANSLYPKITVFDQLFLMKAMNNVRGNNLVIF